MAETMQDAADTLKAAAAEAAAAAASATGVGGEEGGDGLGGQAAENVEAALGGEGGAGDDWGFLTKTLVAVMVIIVCLVAARVLRGEKPEERRLRLRTERRAKKKAAQTGPDEIDRLLSTIVRRQPGQAPPPGAVPISGRGVGRGAQQGRGRGGAAASAAAARAMAAVGGRGNGAGRGAMPPGAADNRPKLRWEQSNEEVEIVVRVDPKVSRSDVKVEVTSTMLKLSLRQQPVIAGHLFKPVDPEGCTWQIDNPAPGHPKEVTITLLKSEVATRKEDWWRAPLKGLENRAPARRPSQPADPEMVRKAIEAIKAKSAASGAAGAKPGIKLGAKNVGQAGVPSGGAARAGAEAANGGGARPGTASAAPSTAGAAVGAKAGIVAPAAGAGAAAAAAAPVTATEAVAAAAPATKSGKGGKKKNRKKK